MGGVKIKAPRGWDVGKGCPPPHWGRDVPLPTAPPQKNLAFFASKSHVCDAL